MSVQAEITRISGAKSDIADAIAAKGVEVPSGTKIDGMAELIAAIVGGGGSPIRFVDGEYVVTDEDIGDATEVVFEDGFAVVRVKE